MTATAVQPRPVLMAHSEQDARRWMRRFPGRWVAWVAVLGGAHRARGVQATSVDITPMADGVGEAHYEDFVDVLRIATFPVFGEVPVNYLPR